MPRMAPNRPPTKAPHWPARPACLFRGPGGKQDNDDDADLVEISSPMVGTFYSASDPDTPPFAKVGMHVQADTVICIVEAMKVFNEIKAEVSGTIERILVKNEQSLEYGQPMFLVRPQ